MAETFPRRFGRYTLIEHLAQGGMGSLYLAYQGELGMEKLCVVKTVLRELADKEYVARFRDEAKVVVRLSHGNLVPVFDSGQVAGEIYLAMDYVEGKDLRAIYAATYASLRPKYGHWVIFDHCLPFDVTRAYDEATAHPDPRIWTATRDQQMWQALAS